MCTTCGCSDNASVRVTNVDTSTTTHAAEHAHHHSVEGHGHHTHAEHGAGGHGHEHAHLHEHHHDAAGHENTVAIQEALLAKNDHLAAHNREWFQEQGIVALNLVSSPGSGKTTLLEQTILHCRDAVPMTVIEGDQETLNDAERIKATGCRVVQINTGAGCHLEADMVARGLEELQPSPHSVVMIENVGNLVCPALFDLGEDAKIAILSVTEGEDKPLKYPHMFRSSSVMLLNKIDLLPYVTFSVSKCIKAATLVNPDLRIIQVSATTGEGMDAWYEWIRERVQLRATGARR